MGRAEAAGFEYRVRGERPHAEVTIWHHGTRAGALRGAKAEQFLDDVSESGTDAPDQQLMARLTGNYRRGNERQARNHPRNAGRR